MTYNIQQNVQQLDRRITDLEKARRISSGAGTISSAGTFTLATGAATSTVKTDSNVASTTVIFYVPTDAGGWSVDGALSGIVSGSGQFTISHQASASTRSYAYVAISPA